MLVYEPATRTSLDDLEDELARALACMKTALADGDAVVVSLDDRDLQGVRSRRRRARALGLRRPKLGARLHVPGEGRRTIVVTPFT